MAVDPTIRQQVLAKLGGVSKQALSGRVKKIKGKVPMTSDDAVYVIAHGLGIDLSRRLDSVTLERVGRYISRLEPPAASSPTSVRTRRGPARPRLIVVRAFEDYAVPGLEPSHAVEGKRMAERVYPVLYLFENSARDLIDGLLSKAMGPDWWDTLPAAQRHHKAVAQRVGDESRDAWHGKRGDRPLHYVDLSVLAEIVADPAAWPHFADIFPRKTWFEGVVDDLNVSRRVIAHMNPISDADVRQVEAGFRRWRQQLEARQDVIADRLGN